MLTLLKHAKNFVAKKSKNKPVFEGIYFSGDYIAVSDTQVLVLRTNFPSEKKLVHWGTGLPIQGTYPNMMGCIPRDCASSFEITDLTAWIKALKIAQMINYRVSLNVVIGGVELNTKLNDHSYVYKAPISLVIGVLPGQIHFDVRYMIDILRFFKDSGVTVVTMGFNTELSPIKLTTDKDVLAVLSPVVL